MGWLWDCSCALLHGGPVAPGRRLRRRRPDGLSYGRRTRCASGEWSDGADEGGLRERRARESAHCCAGRAAPSQTLPHHDSYRTHRLTVATAAVFEAASHAFALGTRRVSVATAVGAVLLAPSRCAAGLGRGLSTRYCCQGLPLRSFAWSGWWCWWRPGGDGEWTVAVRRHSHAMGCRWSSEGYGCCT